MIDPTYLIVSVCLLVVLLWLVKWWRDVALLRTVTTLRRGTPSERNLVVRLLKFGVPSSCVFHDLYVEKRNGRYSQIDVIAVTQAGIIVFEVKDYSGWIFGKGYQTYWTQVLNYGKEKYRFYNPVMQNRGHIAALKERLRPFADVPFYSIVVFYGNCEFRDVSEIPRDVTIVGPGGVTGLCRTIMEQCAPAHYADWDGTLAALRKAVANGEDSGVRARHAESIKQW